MRLLCTAALWAGLVIGRTSAEPPDSKMPATRPGVSPAAAAGHPGYETRHVHDPDGIGKFYMGREIAQVMGHEGADWLDRPEREREERGSRLLSLLELRPGQVVADIGAGSGYYALPMARLVGPRGKVLAVDIQQEMLDIIKQKQAQQKIANIERILGRADDPMLPPESVDLALLVDVYHEFEWPYEMMQRLVRSLKPGGRVALVEFRLEDPKVPIKRVHKMSEAQVIREMRPHSLRHLKTIASLPVQHVVLFEKPAPTTRPSTRPAR